MKRARIMLAAIAVLALVGGTLAFKANNRFTTHFFKYTTSAPGKPAGASYCIPASATTTPNASPLTYTVYSTLGTTGLTYYTTVNGNITYCTSVISPVYTLAGE